MDAVSRTSGARASANAEEEKGQGGAMAFHGSSRNVRWSWLKRSGRGMGLKRPRKRGETLKISENPLRLFAMNSGAIAHIPWAGHVFS
jgi:hypothetical protein